MIRLGTWAGPDLANDPRVVEARRNLFEYLRRPESERAERRAPIDEKIFFDPFINDALRRRSYGKCAFCEARRDGDEVLDHYRPLRDARDIQGQPARDFYAWLAYEFDNMILLCRECAHRKGTNFPVLGERAPYLAGLAEVRRLEEPVLIDPYRDQVDQHFDFLCDGWCEPLGLRGEYTVKTLDLNRDRLVAERAREIETFLDELISTLSLVKPSNTLRELFHPSQKFAGARLNILQRVLRGLTFRGRAIGGQATTLAARFGSVLASGISHVDRRRLEQRLEELPEIDRERERWDGLAWEVKTIHLEVLSPWVPVKRNGGVAHVEVRNFKGIEKLVLPIPPRPLSRSAPCLMILGENSVGKSTILQAVALALLGAREARALKLEPDDLLRSPLGDRWDQLSPIDAQVAVGFRFDQRTELTLDAKRGRFEGEEGVSAIVLGYGPRRFFDRRKSERGHRAGSRVHTLFRPTATIPYPGTWLNQLSPERFAEVAQVIRIVLALSDDDQLVRDLDGRICVNLDDRPVPLEWLSEGYRSVFVMVADIVRELMPRFPILEEAEAIVLIDEIETHLHPRWKMRLMTALRRALPNVQFIVTTHDPLCLRGMEDGEVIVLQRSGQGEVTVLEGLPGIKGMRADQLLTSDYFGLSSTVDPETELGMARYVRDVTTGPADSMSEAERLVAHITIGDDAQEQVIHRAMREFIEKRERPVAELRTDVSDRAVKAVLSALESGFE